MKKRNDIAACQGYRGRADMYDYPIEDAGEYAVCDLLGMDEEMNTWLRSKWDERWFPAIDIAIAVNEVNYL